MSSRLTDPPPGPPSLRVLTPGAILFSTFLFCASWPCYSLPRRRRPRALSVAPLILSCATFSACLSCPPSGFALGFFSLVSASSLRLFDFVRESRSCVGLSSLLFPSRFFPCLCILPAPAAFNSCSVLSRVHFCVGPVNVARRSRPLVGLYFYCSPLLPIFPLHFSVHFVDLCCGFACSCCPVLRRGVCHLPPSFSVFLPSPYLGFRHEPYFFCYRILPVRLGRLFPRPLASLAFCHFWLPALRFLVLPSHPSYGALRSPTAELFTTLFSGYSALVHVCAFLLCSFLGLFPWLLLRFWPLFLVLW